MPVGPIGLLCIKNSLNRGMLYGLMSGLGAAFADTFFGAIGCFGISWIGSFLVDHRFVLEVVGSMVLFYLGIMTFIEPISDTAAPGSLGGYGQVFFSTFFLTLANPMTLLSFAGIFAGLGVGDLPDDYFTPAILTAGVFIGSAVWWLALSAGMAYFRDRVNLNARRGLNRVSGAVIFGFGVVAMVHVLLV